MYFEKYISNTQRLPQPIKTSHHAAHLQGLAEVRKNLQQGRRPIELCHQQQDDVDLADH